jgi:hypothetical protein
MNGSWGWLGSVIAATCVAVACTGCAGSGRGHALYTSDRPLAPAEVAELSGYVHHVDGKDVSSIGGTYELLPGCHVIDTPTKWGQAGQTGGVVITTGVVTYTLPMQAGYHYAISVDTNHTTGPTGTAAIHAKELDAGGNVVREFVPASSQHELDACARCAKNVTACDPQLAAKKD